MVKYCIIDSTRENIISSILRKYYHIQPTAHLTADNLEHLSTVQSLQLDMTLPKLKTGNNWMYLAFSVM